MREIEVKVRITDKQKLLTKLEEKGITLGEEVQQHDLVYGWPGAQDAARDSVWLRVRTELRKDGAFVNIFTLKKSVVGHLDSIEHETVIENPDEMLAAFAEMGYELYSDLTKTRRKGRWGEVEICVDELPALGSFIEVEMMQDKDSNHNEVVDLLWQFLTSLGLDKKDEIHEGYDVLERHSRGL